MWRLQIIDALDNGNRTGVRSMWPDNMGLNFCSRIIQAGIGTTVEEDIQICYPSLVFSPLKGYQKGVNWPKMQSKEHGVETVWKFGLDQKIPEFPKLGRQKPEILSLSLALHPLQ